MISVSSSANSAVMGVRVGKLIMIRRLAIDLSILDLSNISNVPSEIIEDFESGSLRPEPVQLAKLSECLSIPIDWFFSNRNADVAPLQIQITLAGDLSSHNDNRE
jgi:ribosome-binding protein aMBF1 (putative translation factor)